MSNTVFFLPFFLSSDLLTSGRNSQYFILRAIDSRALVVRRAIIMSRAFPGIFEKMY